MEYTVYAQGTTTYSFAVTADSPKQAKELLQKAIDENRECEAFAYDAHFDLGLTLTGQVEENDGGFVPAD